MTRNFTLKVPDGPVIVTGASHEVGSRVVQNLLRGGARVGACARDIKTLENDLSGGRANRSAALLSDCDVTNEECVTSFVEQVVERFGGCAGLVNCAGITSNAPAISMSDRMWREVVDTNLTGTRNMCRAVLPHMVRAEAGSIVNVGSIVALSGFVTMSNYAAAEAGVIALTQTLAREFGRFNVRANVIEPGLTATRVLEDIPEDRRAGMLERVPLGRFADPDDIAGVVEFLLSTASEYISGAVIRVDGGASL